MMPGVMVMGVSVGNGAGVGVVRKPGHLPKQGAPFGTRSQDGPTPHPQPGPLFRMRRQDGTTRKQGPLFGVREDSLFEAGNHDGTTPTQGSHFLAVIWGLPSSEISSQRRPRMDLHSPLRAATPTPAFGGHRAAGSREAAALSHVGPSLRDTAWD